jgi:hypothetical protein
MKDIFLILLGVLLLSFGLTESVFASVVIQYLPGTPIERDFVVGPGIQELWMDPGTQTKRQIIVTNRLGVTMAFRIDIEDFQGSRDPRETFILLGGEEGPYSLRDYLKPEKTEFILEHGQRIILPITVFIPEDAEPGGLYGAIIVSTDPEPLIAVEEIEEVEPGIGIITRIGVLYFVRVKGDVIEQGFLQDFRVTRRFFEKGPIPFEIFFQNDGTVHLTPHGTIEIKNLLGKPVGEVEIDHFFAMPDSLRMREVRWEPGGLTFGRYTATLFLNRGYQDIIDQKSLTFWVIPWRILLIVGIGVILLILFIKWIISHFHFEIRRKAQPLLEKTQVPSEKAENNVSSNNQFFLKKNETNMNIISFPNYFKELGFFNKIKLMKEKMKEFLLCKFRLYQRKRDIKKPQVKKPPSKVKKFSFKFYKKEIKKTISFFLIFIIISCLIITYPYPLFAYVMESPSFRMQADSINIGGQLQTSPSYRMEVTIGEIATGRMESPTFRLGAGFQHVQEVFLSISVPVDITMSPSIPGVTGGIGNGSVVWRVITDNRAGYTLRLRAAASPALTRTAAPPADNFADYVPATAGIPDVTFITPAAASRFGFTVDGADTALLFRRGGTAVAPTGACGSAALVDPVGQCWINTTTTDRDIATRTVRTDIAGVDTTVGFRAQVTAGRHQLDGIYNATIIATVLTN